MPKRRPPQMRGRARTTRRLRDGRLEQPSGAETPRREGCGRHSDFPGAAAVSRIVWMVVRDGSNPTRARPE
jgi:hypothetical protein